MKKLDRIAQEKYGIPSIILMELAGRGSAKEISKDFKGKSIKAAIFCGRGNNGGDGFVCARYLKNRGVAVDVFLFGKSKDVKNNDPRLNLAILKKMRIPVTELSSGKSGKSIEGLKKNFKYDVAVDAIFGIGFRGRLPDQIAEVVEFLNKASIPVYAIDVPSGLNATTGAVQDLSVKARKTITFGFAKKGFYKKDGPKITGKIVVKDIGFPANLLP